MNNFKNKVTKKKIPLKQFVAAAELRSADTFWLKENQKDFDEGKLKILRDLKLIYDEYELT